VRGRANLRFAFELVPVEACEWCSAWCVVRGASTQAGSAPCRWRRPASSIVPRASPMPPAWPQRGWAACKRARGTQHAHTHCHCPPVAPAGGLHGLPEAPVTVSLVWEKGASVSYTDYVAVDASGTAEFAEVMHHVSSAATCCSSGAPAWRVLRAPACMEPV
jgi:hypothetical protein